MIVAEQKPVVEIARYIEKYDKVLLVGCAGCVTVCSPRPHGTWRNHTQTVGRTLFSQGLLFCIGSIVTIWSTILAKVATVYSLRFHCVCYVKYRRKVLTPEISLYSHVTPILQKEAAIKIDEVLSKKN